MPQQKLGVRIFSLVFLHAGNDLPVHWDTINLETLLYYVFQMGIMEIDPTNLPTQAKPNMFITMLTFYVTKVRVDSVKCVRYPG